MDLRFRRTVRLSPTGPAHSKESPWARPKPAPPESTAGIEVAELPQVEIDIPPAIEPTPSEASALQPPAVVDGDPRLLPIVLVVVGIIALAALLWALLV